MRCILLAELSARAQRRRLCMTKQDHGMRGVVEKRRRPRQVLSRVDRECERWPAARRVEIVECKV